MFNKKYIILSFLSLIFLSNNVWAATSANSTTKATANLTSSCKVSAADVPFGVIQPTTTTTYLYSNGNLAILCSNNISYTITFSKGIAVFYRNRHMETLSANGNTDQVRYNLYQDTSYTQPFGDGTDGTYTMSKIGTGTTQNISVYGRLDRNIYLTPDNYGDTITVTLSY